MELDICDLALLVDQGESVHSKALHVAVVQGNANVILQEGELQDTKEMSEKAIASCTQEVQLTKHLKKFPCHLART